MSLRVKLSLIAALLTLSGLALAMTITYWSLLGLRLFEMDRESRLLAEVILDAAVLRPEGTIRVPAIVETYLTDEHGANSAQAYLDGQLVWEGGVLNAPRPLDPAGVLEGRGERSVGGWRVYTARDEEEQVIIQVGRPLAAMQEILELYRDIAVPSALLLSLVTSAIAWLVVGLALRPLRGLAEAAAGFEEDGSIPQVPGGDEPAILARSFAGLLSRLRGQRQREQRFLAYAAHELRTPLSALRAGLEAARSGRLPPGQELMDRLHGEALRLERLAQNLLALSRAEGGETRREPLGLERLAEAAYDRFQPLALEKGFELTLEAEPAPAVADARLLEQALDNLIANALRHARKGTIAIRSGSTGPAAYLEVADAGPGMPESPREGLGLRVVRAVARVHGGELIVDGQGMDGKGVRLLIPAAPELSGEG